MTTRNVVAALDRLRKIADALEVRGRVITANDIRECIAKIGTGAPDDDT